MNVLYKIQKYDNWFQAAQTLKGLPEGELIMLDELRRRVGWEAQCRQDGELGNRPFQSEEVAALFHSEGWEQLLNNEELAELQRILHADADEFFAQFDWMVEVAEALV